jgi:CTP synthase
MEGQKNITLKGGTMRLGAYKCELEEGSLIHKIYGQNSISERHRHRYEFNNEYLEVINKAGLKPSGVNPESSLVEVVELKDHPWFIGVQYHPELKSTVQNPHPLFVGFVKAAMNYHDLKNAKN